MHGSTVADDGPQGHKEQEQRVQRGCKDGLYCEEGWCYLTDRQVLKWVCAPSSAK